MKKTVLVVGGAGYIGSHVNKQLRKAGYETIIYDNLSTGSRETVANSLLIKGDIADAHLLNKVFKTHQIDAVMHFAALTDVGESMESPIKYYRNNVCCTLNLLDCMQKNNISLIIFSSSAAIFGMPLDRTITESHPKNPINPYGRSKLIAEQMIKDMEETYGIRSCCLRYFNAAGGDPDGEIKNRKKKESNLIPRILHNLKTGNPQITIFGTDYSTPDGTCIRDYIHIEDLGRAHIQAMEHLLEGEASSCYNLGNGQGFSVRDVVNAIEKITQIPIHAINGKRRPGDPPILLANSQKASQELGWKPQYPKLEEMIAHAWNAL